MYLVYLLQVGMAGPLPKDDVTVTIFKAWGSSDEYEAHKKGGHLEKLKRAMKERDCEADRTVIEFAQTQHFAKPL